MKKIKILISTYTEEIQMSDFCSLYFDTFIFTENLT